MANKPVVGIIECPHCGKSNMVGMEWELQVSVLLLRQDVHGEADAASPYDADYSQRE